MDSFDPKEELRTILNEYGSFFQSCHLNAPGTPSGDVEDSNGSNQYYLDIKTNEGNRLKVSVNATGWYQLSDYLHRSRHRETFEGLMMVLNPSFQVTFNNELTNKLNALIQQETE
ncbi:uncharacterized protein RJT20DRAFT_34796 [Scheffersomyces xylosifermentans]|uniref:uncharacterized protein n=1 Tax=Scheffersomyces xylosifermentans TaxID=1304137 RepID=UPI00315CD6E7